MSARGPRRPAAPDARRIAAEVVRRALADGAFAAAALSAELDRYPQLSPRDRAFSTELAYGALRTGRHLEGRLARLATRGLTGLDDETRAHLWIGAYQLLFLNRVPAHAAVSSAVAIVKEHRGQATASFVNAVLRKLAREAEGAPRMSATDAVLAGAPRWLVRALDRALGEGEGAAFLRAGPVPPPIGLRVRRGDPDAWAETLRDALPDADVARGRAAPAALLVRGGGDPRAFPGVDQAELVVQEEGSQVVAAAAAAEPGDRVLDACAGRGNKTLALLDAVGPEGVVDAANLHGPKLARLRAEVERTGLHVGNTHEVDWSIGSGTVPLERYDRVLVDAPCTGVGTLRRRPEILLRRTPDDLATIPALQRKIVRNAARAVRPGGSLTYAVCSVLREELEEVVADLEGFRLLDVRRIAPHREGTDGYAIATLVRSGAG